MAITGSIKVARFGAEAAVVYAGIHALCFEEPWSAEAFADLLSLPHTLGFLADACDGPPAGLLLLQCAADQAEVLTIGVVPAARGQGTGRQLLSVGLDALQAIDVQEVFLDVAEDNIPAIALYRACGFQDFGRRARYYKREGERVDALTLRRIAHG